MKKKHLLLGILALMMSGAALDAQTTWDISATVTDHVTATLDIDNGVLNISGTGAMTDYRYGGAAQWETSSRHW